MPDSMSAEIPNKPEKKEFEHSWLVSSEDEFKKLRQGELGDVGKRIAFFHQTGMVNALGVDELSSRAAKWGDEAFEEGDEVWPELVPYMERMTEKIKKMSEASVSAVSSSEPMEVRVLKEAPKPKEETPEAWTRFVLTQLDLAEKVSERKLLRSTEDKTNWNAIDETLAAMPQELGTDFIPDIRDREARRFFEAKYPEGFYLKQRLETYVEARRHINDRYCQVVKARGSLEKLGLGSEAVPEAFSYVPQDIHPADWWAMFNGEELFPELPSDISKELAPDLNESTERWLEVGIAGKTLPIDLLISEEVDVINKIFTDTTVFDRYYATDADKDKKKKRKIDIEKHWPSPEDVYKVLGNRISMNELAIYANIPTFDNSRNVSEFLTDIRSRLAQNLGSAKGEDLAQRLLSVWLTIPLLDKNRTSAQGNSEERDLMWGDRKRVYELGAKEREPGLDYTVGRYFVSSPDQGSEIKDDDARLYPKLKHRKQTLEINAERGVLIEKDSYFEGEIMSDFLHNTMISVRDELVPGKAIRRNMASYVINADGTIRNGGFKNIPYFMMGSDSYTATYFGYVLGKSKQISGELFGITWKDPKEMATDDFWNKRRDTIERLEHISPRFIIREFQYRGAEIRKLLLQNRIVRFDPEEVAKISGYSDEKDLDVISSDSARLAAKNIIRGNAEAIAKAAKDKSTAYWTEQSAKIRMIHALGAVWPGSLDAVLEASNFVSKSAITPDLLRKIIIALNVSRYLEGEYLEHFKYEAWKEMGFGAKWHSSMARYRNKLDPTMWED